MAAFIGRGKPGTVSSTLKKRKAKSKKTSAPRRAPKKKAKAKPKRKRHKAGKHTESQFKHVEGF